MTVKYKRRKRLIVSQKFQLKFIGQILGLMFIAVFLTGYLVYITTWVMFGEKLAAVYPQGLLMDIVTKVNMVLFLRMVFLTPLVVMIGLILSNKIAGPLYHIQSFLKEAYKGNFGKRLVLRRGDEMQDLAAAINLLISKLDSEKRERTQLLSEIDSVLNDMKKKLENQDYCDLGVLKEQVENVKDRVKEINTD